MSGDLSFVMIFCLRENNNSTEALNIIKEKAEKYDGFEIEDNNSSSFFIIHNEIKFLIKNIFESEYHPNYPLKNNFILMSVDYDYMFDDEGTDNPNFWIFFQNVIAIIVAIIDPTYGNFTDDEEMKRIIESDLEMNLLSGGYYSFDYIKLKLPLKENIIRTYATRELTHGLLVINMAMSQENATNFRNEME